MEHYDVVIIGAGAAGMFCAVEAGRRGRRVLVLEHNKAPGEKIRISGGGRCNFTNLHCDPAAFLSQNPKFVISALSRYSQWDFIDRMSRSGIAWHEKTLGQLFCDGSAKQIVAMLTADMADAGVELRLQTSLSDLQKTSAGFEFLAGQSRVRTTSLVVASGGKSIPKMGASGLGYDLARQFGIEIIETRPGLVPLTFAEPELTTLKPLAGLSVTAAVSNGLARFEEGLLFTHRGLSGPSILQISSYWHTGDPVLIDLLPGEDALAFLKSKKSGQGAQSPGRVLAEKLPKRLAAMVAESAPAGKTLANLTDKDLQGLADRINRWPVKPVGTEGYRTAEVTLGGVSTEALHSKTLEARAVPGLYFVGEVVDVTGWLGGYNFQWAWSSGWAAGQVA